MANAFFAAILGYLSGSVLFARLAAKLFRKPEILTQSPDGNPGAANAFTYGGFWCGLFVLAGDLAKGFLPVWCWAHSGLTAPGPLWAALILAAPVVGHGFPIFYRFRGGKGIAVTFGCLLGLMPRWVPAVTLALCFLFFSLILRITPHLYRTGATYLCAALALALRRSPGWVLMGFCLMAGVVFLRLHKSGEERERPEVKLLWMR